jgi:hypothetical protein
MKTFSHIRKPSALLAGIVIMFSVSVKDAGAQVVAIGHITAEVVESVSASANMLTTLNLSTVTTGDLTISMTAARMNTRKVDLGEIAINSGKNIACNVMIKPATLSDNKGNQFVIEPATTLSGQQDIQRADGSQNLRLTGQALLEQNQANGLYSGSYTMVFAYN